MKTFVDEDLDTELEWAELSHFASLAARSGHESDARSAWHACSTLATCFAPNDPRRAASAHNLAVAHRLAADLEEAERGFQKAMTLWKSAATWVAQMRLEARARSSLFHLRLEQRHRDRYDAQARTEYQQHLLGGSAATLSSLAELLQTAGRLDDARQLYRRALQQRTNASLDGDYGIDVMRSNMESISATADASGVPPPDVDRTPFQDRAYQQRWIVDDPPVFTDEGRLFTAVYLTRILSRCEAGHGVSGTPGTQR